MLSGSVQQRVGPGARSKGARGVRVGVTWGAATEYLPLVLAPAGSAWCFLPMSPPHDASVPLAEVCGGLLAASPLLGAPGEVAGYPTAALPVWELIPGGLAQCCLLVPSVDKRASVSVVGGCGPWGGQGLIRFLTCSLFSSGHVTPPSG